MALIYTGSGGRLFLPCFGNHGNFRICYTSTIYGFKRCYGMLLCVQKQNIFYLALIALGLIVMGVSVIIRHLDDFDILLLAFLVGLFVVCAIVIVIFTLIKLNKKWNKSNA